MKEEEYVILLMSTYYTNERVGEDNFQTIGGESINFNYLYNVNKHHQHKYVL